jgi:thiamine monophosphate synthase
VVTTRVTLAETEAEWPRLYRITPADVPPQRYAALLESLASSRDEPSMIQLRLPMWPVPLVRRLAETLASRPASGIVRILLNADVEATRSASTEIGVHLKSAQLMSMVTRPIAPRRAVSGSCHNIAQLDRAVEIGLDFVTLSPVARTAIHPDAEPLGWRRFRDVVSQCRLPVYALGGLSPADLPEALNCGAHGVAGIRGFWPGDI